MDGHIGFNEPGSSLASKTRLKTLSWATKLQNAQDFGGAEKVPDLAITMGIGTIMEAKTILLLATGANKAYILSQALEGPVTSMVPASILQMHPRVKVIVDEEAAIGLRLYPYYKHTEELRARYGLSEIAYIDKEDLE
jgi:glucosamine-6-phosphate deaminase